jgi:hypothetical protein
MLNVMRKVKFIFPLLILFFVLSAAIKPSIISGKASTLEIKGYVFNQETKVEGALVKLYQNNRVVQKVNTKKGKFQFVLFSGMRYMIEVFKFGSITERIQISTVEKTEFGGKYSYEFRVDLMNASKFSEIDISALDFPTAIIKYDEEEGEYMHDIKYSNQVKEDLRTLEKQVK